MAVNILKLFIIPGTSAANIIAYTVVTFVGVDSPWVQDGVDVEHISLPSALLLPPLLLPSLLLVAGLLT